MKETQASVTEWANTTFGYPVNDARIAARANEEMAELLRAVTANDTPERIVEEVADIIIILYRLVERQGYDLHSEIDRKMEKNRKRVWKKDGSGHGYHVREDVGDR